MKKLALILTTLLLVPSFSLAQELTKQEIAQNKDIEMIDSIIAGSLIFKLQCQLSGILGPIRADEQNPEKTAIAKALKLYAKDLDNLSQTKRGIMLKKEGHMLLEYLNEVVVKTMAPVKTEKEQKEFKQFIRKHGMKIYGEVDIIELTNLTAKKLKYYNQLAGAPKWKFSKH